MAIQRPEESVQVAIEKNFATVLNTLGPCLDQSQSGIEKADELFSYAVTNLDLSGAPNRAACAVISALAHHAPTILQKSFYKLSSKFCQECWLL